MPGARSFLGLLAPAKTAAIGREAVLHGADAVYIGGPAFGARYNAGNTVSEIAGLVAFAHRFLFLRVCTSRDSDFLWALNDKIGIDRCAAVMDTRSS